MSRRWRASIGMMVCAFASQAEAAPERGSDVHGFLEVSFKNAYVTPRGLVVHVDGIAIQPIAGIALALYSGSGPLDRVVFVNGVWNDLHTSQDSPDVGGWNEFDYFAAVSIQAFHRLEFGATYSVFTSPPHNFKLEHNVELKLGFDDTGYLTQLAVHPYAKVFFAVAGDSPVVLGGTGGAFDVELGVVPTRSLHAILRAPITVALPSFVTFGSPGFFGDGGVMGVLVTGPEISIPLGFPARLGAWHVQLSATYFHLFDENLVAAARLLGNSGDRNLLVGRVGIGMAF